MRYLDELMRNAVAELRLWRDRRRDRRAGAPAPRRQVPRSPTVTAFTGVLPTGAGAGVTDTSASAHRGGGDRVPLA